MARRPIPIGQLSRRIPEAGRIRTGEKDAKRGFPKSRSSFRFTSAERENVAQVAAIYGGEVVPFKDAKSPDRWQVSTEATEIRVALPPDPLGGTPIYQLYGGGGPERRCDGVTCEQWRKGPDGPEPFEVDCICAAKERLECDVTTHLSLFLPEIRLTGAWRLTTKSYNAAVELPAMVETIRDLQDRGIVRGVLSLKPHQQVLAGETRKFLVPTLGVDASMDALASGGGMVAAALPAAPAVSETPVALNAGDPTHGLGDPDGADKGDHVPKRLDSDDEVVDAEIVEDGGGDVDNQEPPGSGTVDAEGVVPAPAASTQVDLEDLETLMRQRGVGRAPARRIYNEHAEAAGRTKAGRWSEMVPGPDLDATYATIEQGGDDDDPAAAGIPSGEVTADRPPPSGSPSPPGDTAQTALIMRIEKSAPRHGRERWDAARHAVIGHATAGRTTSSKDATHEELLAAHRVLDEIEAGVLELHLRATGDYVVRPRPKGVAA